MGVRQQDLEALKKSHPKLVYQDFLSNVTGSVIYLCTDMPPFNDVRVRRAISMAIDRQGIIDGVYIRGEPTPAIARGATEWSLPIDQLGEGARHYQYDPKEARRLLAEAGFAKGFKTHLNTTGGYGPDLVDAVQLEAIRKPCRPVAAISSSILAVMKLRTTTRIKLIKHKINVTDLDHSSTGFYTSLIVLPLATGPTMPSVRALHHPAFRQWREALRPLWTGLHFEVPPPDALPSRRRGHDGDTSHRQIVRRETRAPGHDRAGSGPPPRHRDRRSS